MKILIVTNSSTGLYNFRRMLIERLLESNKVVAYTPYYGAEKELQGIGCELHELEMDRRGMNPLSDYRLYHRIVGILRTEKPDYVITYTIKPNIYASMACQKLGIQYAVNITGLGTAFEKGSLLRKMIVIMYKGALKKAKIVFFENKHNQSFFIKKHIISEEHTCLLMGAGVDLERFYYQPYPENNIFRFIFIGRIMREKGIDELFSAMDRLYMEGEKVILDICGDFEDNYEKKLEIYIKKGWLNYYGRQEDVRAFIGHADCFILPSYHEGMANTNLECAASGRPIITSNISGCKEAVTEESGLLCEPKDVNSLYETMKQMLKMERTEREAMGKAGRKHMEKVFDKKMVVKKTIDALGI